jgi:hypothetical protein
LKIKLKLEEMRKHNNKKQKKPERRKERRGENMFQRKEKRLLSLQ